MSVEIDNSRTSNERWPAFPWRSSDTGEPDALQIAKVVETLVPSVWATDARGRWLYLSPAARTALGCEPADLNASIGNEYATWKPIVHPDEYSRVSRHWGECLETGHRYKDELRVRSTTGTYAWTEVAAQPTRDDQGQITGWYGTLVDIRAHKEAAAILSKREWELSHLVDMVPSHVWRLGPDGEPSFFNRRMIDFLGPNILEANKPALPPLATLLETSVHPDDRSVFRDALNRSLASGEPFRLHYRLRRADGVYRWMSSRAEPIRDQDGRIAHWYGLCHDIDDQIQTEQALRQSEQRLQLMIDAVPVRLWSVTPDGGPVYFNRRYIDHLRSVVADSQQLISPRIDKLMGELVHPEDAPGVWKTLQASFQTGDASLMRFRWRESDFSYRWVECRLDSRRDADGSVAQWYGVSLDIDDEVRARDALYARERELLQLINMVPIYLWRLRPDGTPNFFNKRLIDFLGKDIDVVDGTDPNHLALFIATIVHPDDTQAVIDSLKRSLLTGEHFAMKYRLRRADGEYRWVEGSAEPMRDENGTIIQWYGLCHDIDDRLHAEEALRHRERELSLLVDLVPSHLWRVAPDGETTMVNKDMADFLGVPLGDKRQLDDAIFDTMFHPDEHEQVWTEFNRCLKTGENFSMKYRMRRADGVYRWMSGRAAPMRGADGNIVQWFGLCHDIDDQIRAEEALLRTSDRLARATQAASLAELSASIAHEVNQPLAAIVANSHACHRWLSAETPNINRAKIIAERIIRDANSAADVINRIRALFRRTPRAKTHEDINRLIAEVCALMADEINAKNVRVRSMLAPGLPPVRLDRIQVQQVLLNLIRNGLEAMEHMVDGTRILAISTSCDDTAAIRVDVCDAGTGFKDAEQVFEPFFTTKTHGMGMGLAICRSIIESHGGRLWAANNDTNGATVTFTLPLISSETS